MSAERISARYAKALIDLAIEQDKLERVREDVAYFVEASRVRDLAMLLKSPIVHGSTKRKIFNALFSGKFDKLTMAFLDIIVRKGRESHLSDIGKAFIEQYHRIRQISTARLTTAVPVSAAQLGEIREKIRAAGITFPNVDIETHVNPEIIGGFIIEFDDKLYDASVAHRLEQMRKGFTTNAYEPLI